MSIIIRGMEMPIKCAKCPIADISAEYYFCEKIDWFGKERPSDCPLIEIPTPHGDLVDLNDTVHPNDSMRRMTLNEQLRRTCEGWSAEKKNYVVIEAEGSETE